MSESPSLTWTFAKKRKEKLVSVSMRIALRRKGKRFFFGNLKEGKLNERTWKKFVFVFAEVR
jgi:hypothetical protein